MQGPPTCLTLTFNIQTLCTTSQLTSKHRIHLRNIWIPNFPNSLQSGDTSNLLIPRNMIPIQMNHLGHITQFPFTLGTDSIAIQKAWKTTRGTNITKPTINAYRISAISFSLEVMLRTFFMINATLPSSFWLTVLPAKWQLSQSQTI